MKRINALKGEKERLKLDLNEKQKIIKRKMKDES